MHIISAVSILNLLLFFILFDFTLIIYFKLSTLEQLLSELKKPRFASKPRVLTGHVSIPSLMTVIFQSPPC